MKDDLPEMVRTVEQFIQDKTGRRIKIIFDNPMKIHMHLQMLAEAYSIALAYYNKQNN
jgi:hypothetical protein